MTKALTKTSMLNTEFYHFKARSHGSCAISGMPIFVGNSAWMVKMAGWVKPRPVCCQFIDLMLFSSEDAEIKTAWFLALPEEILIKETLASGGVLRTANRKGVVRCYVCRRGRYEQLGWSRVGGLTWPQLKCAIEKSALYWLEAS